MLAMEMLKRNFSWILLSAIFFCVNTVYGVDYTWVGNTNAWALSTNWSPAAPTGGPTATDNVIIAAVPAGKVAPVISISTAISNLTMASGLLTINTSITLTVTGIVNVTGATTRIAGAGNLNIGSSSVPNASITIGNTAAGTIINPVLNIFTNSLSLSGATLGTMTAQAQDLAISACTFAGIVSLTKNGTSSSFIDGITNFNTTATFVNAGAGSLLFGQSSADFISFKGITTFTKQTGSTGQLEVARFGTAEFQRSLTYNAPAGEVNLFGNVGGGTCIFTGGLAQTIGGTGAGLNFNKITIDKTANNVTLTTPVALVTVSGAAQPEPRLNLTSGLIITSNSTTPARVLTVNEGTIVTLNADPNKSFVSGPMQKIGTTAFTFPVGKGTAYKPITISAPVPAGTTTFTAEYFNAVPPSSTSTSTIDPDIISISACEYWKLNRDLGTSNVRVTLTWPIVTCEDVQNTGLKFIKFNTTTNKWESIPAALDAGNRTLATSAELSAYGNVTFGYASKRIYVDTQTLDVVSFSASGAQLNAGNQYKSGVRTPLLPISPTTGVSTITLDILAGNDNDAMKFSFDIDNAYNISNVRASMDNTTTFYPVVNEFFTIDNAPANGKALKFLKGDESTPVLLTNLTDGTVFSNAPGTQFSITGTTGYTISSFRILTLDDVLVKGPLTAASWDGTNLSNAEVTPGVYKFELVLNNNSNSYTYKGEVIVK